MDEESITFDDVLFDRLVDGELSAAERRTLLASLDGRPSGWRKCALAFLEAQTWQDELGRMIREPAPVESTEIVPQKTERPASGFTIAGRPATSWMALAASVMIAFTLGLALRTLSLPHPNAAPNPFNTSIASAPPQMANLFGGPATTGDAVNVWIRDDAGQPRQLRVPLVDATTMDQRMGLRFRSGVPSNVRAQLEQNGYQVESKRRYAAIWLDNGQPLMVPVEDTRIVPVGNPVY
jgi:hypothetical protein